MQYQRVKLLFLSTFSLDYTCLTVNNKINKTGRKQPGLSLNQKLLLFLYAYQPDFNEQFIYKVHFINKSYIIIEHQGKILDIIFE